MHTVVGDLNRGFGTLEDCMYIKFSVVYFICW